MIIEQGIALPLKRRGNLKDETLIVDTLMQMKPGESVLFTSEKDASTFRSTGVIYVRRGKLNANFRFSQRRVDDGVRVWLLEEKNDSPKTIEELAERETNELSDKFFVRLEEWQQSFPEGKGMLNWMEIIAVLGQFYSFGIVDGINVVMRDLPIVKEIDDEPKTFTASAT